MNLVNVSLNLIKTHFIDLGAPDSETASLDSNRQWAQSRSESQVQLHIYMKFAFLLCSMHARACMQTWHHQGALRGVDFPGPRFAGNVAPPCAGCMMLAGQVLGENARNASSRGENYQVEPVARGAHMRHMGETARWTMTHFLHFSRHFSHLPWASFA